MSEVDVDAMSHPVPFEPVSLLVPVERVVACLGDISAAVEIVQQLIRRKSEICSGFSGVVISRPDSRRCIT